MPRDLSRKRSNMGTSQKVTAPIIDKENPQPAIDRIFKEINALKATIGNNAKGTASVPNEGRDGDIRLYSEYGLDGSQGFFIQGKFGEAWASGRLSIDLIKPKTEYSDGPGTPVESYEGGNDGYITSDGVTFEALDNNLDVGDNSDQVARGSHSHDHNSLFITNTGTNTHDEIDAHIADESIHREPGDTVSEISKVDNDTAALGTIDKWARIDHTHVLDQTQTYTFSAQQNFNNSGGTAISAVGDVSIDGNLYVNFAAAETGNTQIDNDLNVDGNATIDGDVVLNYVAGNTNNTNTTTIKGRTTIWNEFFIRKGLSPGQSHIDITTDGTNHFTVDVNDSGVTTLSTPDTIDIAATSLRPDANLTRDLGQLNKKWRTIYAGELFVENLVAQDVMATTGGRIMVAPTTTLKTTLADWGTAIAVEHNIFETDDIAFMQSAPQGFAQTEAIRITSEATAVTVPDPIAATDANQDAIDYFAGAGITKLVSWTVNHNLKHGQWIKIAHNSPTPQEDWSGVYQVFIETDSSLLPTYNNTSTTVYLALPSTVIQSPGSSSIAITTGPYYYNVTRNINGDAGANNWPADTAIVNWGHNQGDGFIDITSTQSVYNSLGPTISLHARSNETTGVNDDWLVPEVARLGNFAGTGYTGNDTFGIMVGSNLENSYQATTDPFVGLVGSQNGLEIFNTDFKMYSGSKLQVLISKYKDSNDVVRNMFALGDEITDSNTGAGADLLFKYDETVGVETNVLTISGNVDLTGNVDITIDSGTIMSAIDHFLPNTNDPNAEGFYLTPRWLGFYKLNDGSPYWPVKLGATADGNTGEPFIELKDHPTNPISFLKYTINDGLEIAGKVTVLGDPLPDIRGIWGNIDWTFSPGTDEGNINNQNQYIRTFDTTTSTNRWYIYIKGTDFENNTFQAYYTDHYQGGGDAETDNTQWSALGAMNGENNETRWYTFSIDPLVADISENKAIKIGKIGGDDGTLRAIIITQSNPIEPEATLQAHLSGSYYSGDSLPSGGQYNVGDTFVHTGEGNAIYTWNGSTWVPTFTEIDGGNITTGTIKGVSVESIDTISDGTNTIPRTKLDLGGNNNLKQFNTGSLPNRYTELDGGVLKYVHEENPGEGVQNSSNPLIYELPMAMQIIRADDLVLGSPTTFNNIGLQNMYDSNYEIIPINETQIVTGQQNIADLNNAGGIAREYLEYTVHNKTNTGFTMKAKLYRGKYENVLDDQSPTSQDQLDNLANNDSTSYGDQTTGGVFDPSNAPQPNSNFFNPNFDLASNKYTYMEGITNSNLVGGANKFNILVRHEYHELLYQKYDEWLGSTYYPGFPGTSYLYFMLRVGEGSGSPFVDDESFFTVTPVGFGGDIQTDALKFTLTNIGYGPMSFGYEIDGWPSGYDSYSNYVYYSTAKEQHMTINFNTPGNNLLINPRVELICFFQRRENSGQTGGIGYHSPMIKDTGDVDDVRLEYVRQGQVPELIEEITGTGYTGAIISKWNNISTGEPLVS